MTLPTTRPARFGAAAAASALIATVFAGCAPAVAEGAPAPLPMRVQVDPAAPQLPATQALAGDGAANGAAQAADLLGNVQTDDVQTKPKALAAAHAQGVKLSAVAIADLIAAKHAEFPPAPQAVIDAARANCKPAPAVDPDADWLDIAVEMITREEGYAPEWEDIGDGMWTIGYGHAVMQSIYPTPPNDVPEPMTAAAAKQLLHDDLATMSYVAAVDNWFDEDLDPLVYATMVSYAYNTGPRGFEKYKIPTTDLAAIAEVLSHASDHHAEQFPGLICRRDREVALIRSVIGG